MSANLSCMKILIIVAKITTTVFATKDAKNKYLKISYYVSLIILEHLLVYLSKTHFMIVKTSQVNCYFSSIII